MTIKSQFRLENSNLPDLMRDTVVDVYIGEADDGQGYEYWYIAERLNNRSFSSPHFGPSRTVQIARDRAVMGAVAFFEPYGIGATASLDDVKGLIQQTRNWFRVLRAETPYQQVPEVQEALQYAETQGEVVEALWQRARRSYDINDVITAKHEADTLYADAVTKRLPALTLAVGEVIDAARPAFAEWQARIQAYYQDADKLPQSRADALRLIIFSMEIEWRFLGTLADPKRVNTTAKEQVSVHTSVLTQLRAKADQLVTSDASPDSVSSDLRVTLRGQSQRLKAEIDTLFRRRAWVFSDSRIVYLKAEQVYRDLETKLDATSGNESFGEFDELTALLARLQEMSDEESAVLQKHRNTLIEMGQLVDEIKSMARRNVEIRTEGILDRATQTFTTLEALPAGQRLEEFDYEAWKKPKVTVIVTSHQMASEFGTQPVRA